jgi:hypothetical protein
MNMMMKMAMLLKCMELLLPLQRESSGAGEGKESHTPIP